MPPATNKILKLSSIFTPDMLCAYSHDVIAFVEDIIFKGDSNLFLSDQQKEFLLAVQNNDRVSAKSGKGIGKTSSVSFLILWFLCCFENPKIIATAPTFPTLESALWPEIGLWLQKSLIKDVFTHTSTQLYLKESPTNWWARPRTATKKENMQGLHAPNMLVIADEASAIPDDIHEALDTTLTSRNNKYVLIGNPTQTSGPFYDSFNKFRKKWFNLTFNAEESPFVKKEQIDYFAEKYGKHHDLYLVNIKGEFPSGSPEAFIPLSDVHAAVVRNHELDKRGDIEIGLDVARFGDDLTVLYWRYGNKVYPAKTLAKSSIIESTNLVYDTVKEIRNITGYDGLIRVKVDDTGVGGGVVDLLKDDRQHNIEVVPCNFGGGGNDKYQNEATVMWANVKDNIRYIGLPDDEQLIEQLSSRRWKISPNGKIAIEPKSDYKKEFKCSPDRADALILCFASKKPERLVIRTFDPLDGSIVKDNLNYAGENKICSVFYTKDNFVSAIYASWDNNRLYIYDEYSGDNPLIYVATNISTHMPLSRVIGNNKMFADGKNDIAYKFRKFNINVQENYMYDELAATDTLSNMFLQKKIIIHSHCKKTIDQLKEWKMDMTKTEQENAYGLCFALTYIVADLKKKSVIQPSINTSYKEYTPSDNTQSDNFGWMF